MVWESFCEKDTAKIGETLAREAKPGEIYLLEGDLGVGKTVFAKGFALGLGITEPITSPTFTIIQEYEQGRLPFYHFDVYRIGDISEMDEIGYEDCFYGDGDSLGFNASKYNKEEALKIGAEEYGCNVNELTVEEAYIYYGFGTDEDGETRTTYWLCDVPKGNSFEAWRVYKK